MGIELLRVGCQNNLKIFNLIKGSCNYSPLQSVLSSLVNVSTNCINNSSRLDTESFTSFPGNLPNTNYEVKNSGKETLFKKCSGLLKSVTKANRESELFALKAMQMVFDRLANSSLSNFKKDIPIAGKIYLFTRMKNLICW